MYDSENTSIKRIQIFSNTKLFTPEIIICK